MKKILGVFAGAIILLIAAIAVLSYLAPEPVARLAIALERQRSGLAANQLEIPGFRIAYLEGGAGEPLVLLHGIGANKDNWTRVAAGLTPHFRVIAPDLPGFGESDKPGDRSYSIEEQVERLHEMVQRLGLTRFHLGGSSMGGWIAAVYAARHPESVQSLWLISPGGLFSSQPSELMERLQAGEPAPLFARNRAEFEAVLGFVMADPPYVPYAVKQVLTEHAAANFALHNRILGQLLEATPLEQQIAGLATPARVVWGEQDRALHVSGAGVLARLLPNASVLILPGIGHLPMLEAPQRVAEDYVRFRAALQ